MPLTTFDISQFLNVSDELQIRFSGEFFNGLENIVPKNFNFIHFKIDFERQILKNGNV